MAEGYLAKKLEDAGIKEITVISSGTGAFTGLSPARQTIQVMREEGIDVSGYLSLTLNTSQIEHADVILVMEPLQEQKVVSMLPEAEEKIYFLREFAEKNKKYIPDPIGKSIEYYRSVLGIIKDSIEGFLTWLKK